MIDLFRSRQASFTWVGRTWVRGDNPNHMRAQNTNTEDNLTAYIREACALSNKQRSNSIGGNVWPLEDDGHV